MGQIALPPVKVMRVRDFSGGLNLRDAQGSLAPNESPDLWNVTLDERGGVQKRLGYIKSNPAAHAAAKVTNTFYWRTGRNKITQAGTGLFKDDATVAFKTFTTTERCGLADFAGKLCIIHPTDGLFTYDGTTVTAVADPDAPKGNALFPWQNKLYAAGNPTNKARLTWSAAGDPGTWAATDFNDIREKDGEQLVALGGASGVDIAGRPGLIAAKRESAYRIYDSTTGAYQTIDANVGAASALSIVTAAGRTIALSQHGIFWTDGISPFRPAGDREEPLWRPELIAFDKLDGFCAGVVGDRVYFSLARAGSTVNDLALEYHAVQEWIVARSDAMSCYATYGKDDQYLLGGSPSVNGQVYRLNKGGSDDGAAIASRWQSRWFEPADGILASLIRLRLLGRGSGSVYFRKEFAVTGGDLRSFEISSTTFKYDTGKNYDTGEKYGPASSQKHHDLHSLGTARAFSIVVEETSTLVGSGPQLLRTGVSPEVGAWALYGFDLLYVPLGLA